MPLPEAHSVNRLGAWLKKQLGVKGLVASSPAPIWGSEEVSEELSAKINAISEKLPESAISLAPRQRYEAAGEQTALIALRQHEGLPPGAAAVLCPKTRDQLDVVITTVHGNGLSVRQTGTKSPATDALPISLSQFRHVEVCASRDGVVRFEAGCSWEDLASATAPHGLAVPDKLRDQFPLPASAAKAGFLDCTISTETRGIITEYETVLPPTGTKWLERLWLFPDNKKASKAFEKVSRSNQAVFTELVPSTQIRLAERAGLFELPWRNVMNHEYAGVRVVFSGPQFAALSAEFAASWPLERAGGFQWNNRILPLARQQADILLASGVTIVSISVPTSFSNMLNLKEKIGSTLHRASLDLSPASQFTPMVFDRACFTGRQLTLTMSVIAPRDYLHPLAQWQAIHTAGLAAIGDQPATDAQASSAVTEESPEWRAIRDALLDENGRLRPVPGEAIASALPPTRNHA